MKEWIWIRWADVDEHRACYTEWSKSERERQIQYINEYIGHLERWYWWTYLQGSNGNTATVKRRGHSGRRRDWDELREQRGNTPSTMCKTDSQWGFAVWHRGLKSGALWPWRGVGRGRRWEGGSRERGHTYVCGWFMLMHGRNQNNIVKQLSLN